VDLRDEVAVARERDVLELEQDLEARRPALLRLVGVRLAHDLPANPLTGGPRMRARRFARRPRPCFDRSSARLKSYLPCSPGIGSVRSLSRLRAELDLQLHLEQIVNWGTGETFRVVDVLNPLDNREPGLVDIEDLRQPVVMTKLDYYWGDWNLSLIAVHERRFNDDPVFGSDFFPPWMGLGLPDREPAQTLGNSEWAAALRGVFEGWDLGLFAARYYEDLPRVEFPGFALAGGELVPLPTRHSRVTLLGSTANVALGNWLLRGELAYLDGLEYFHRQGRETQRVDVLVGVDYSGFTDTLIAVDLVDRWIDGWESSLLDAPDFTRRNSWELAFRLQRDFLRDRLHLTLLAIGFGITLEDGSGVRLGVDYDLRDALTIGGGILLYQDGDLPPLSAFGRNDRVYLQAKYSF
jgi:hypothetical protein